MTILLVEDSPDDVFFFHRAVKKSGLPVTIHVVQDGLQAVDYVSHEGKYAESEAFPRPSLIFLDLKLPHMGGFEFLQWIGQSGRVSSPVVVLTSSQEPSDEQRALALGAASFLTKPATPEQLRQTLSSCFPNASFAVSQPGRPVPPGPSQAEKRWSSDRVKSHPNP